MVSSDHDALMTTAGPCVGPCAALWLSCTSDSEKKSINATWPTACGAPVVQASPSSLRLFESAQEGQAAPRCNTPGDASSVPLASGGRATLASLDKKLDLSFGDWEVSAASNDHLERAPRPSSGLGPGQAQARTSSGPSQGPGPGPCTGQVQAQSSAPARSQGYQCHGSAEPSRCGEAVDFADDVLRHFSVDNSQTGWPGVAPSSDSTTSQQVVGYAAIVLRRPSAAGAAASPSLDQTRPGGLPLDHTRPGGLPVGWPANMDANRPPAGFTPAAPLGTLDITRPRGEPHQAPSPQQRSVPRQAPQPPPQTAQAFESRSAGYAADLISDRTPYAQVGHLPPPPPPVEVLFPGRRNSRDY